MAQLLAGGTPSVDDASMWQEEFGIPWVTIGDMSGVGVVEHTDRSISQAGRSSKNLPLGEPGTVLFAMYASVGAVSQLGIPATWNQALLGITPDPDRADPRFLSYWLRHLGPTLPALARSNTQSNLNAEQVGGLPYPVLSVLSQRAIADFLDTETARIDALITRKQALGELLLSRRQAATASVVGDISDSEARIATGLTWLPSVPASWRVAKLTQLARLGSGHTPSRQKPEYWVDCTIPWVTTGEVHQFRDDRIEFVTETREKISELGLANSGAALHPAGTVVLSRTASAGYSAIMGSDMATSQDFVTWTCGPDLDPRYLLLCLRAMRQDLLGRLAMGSTHKTIYVPDIEAIRIPLPPKERQRSLVDQAWAAFSNIDRARDQLEQQINLLREHRQALITAAVTGQMDVPGVAA